MRKGTMLTSGVLDEITAQARYQSLLEAAERRRLIQQIQGNSPNWLDRLFLAVGNRLITWGLWIKDHGAPAASLDDIQTALD